MRAHSVGRPRRAEIPFELPLHRALARGDTVPEIDGELRVRPRHREIQRAYEQRFLPRLEALTRLDIERLLITHSDPILRDVAHALTATLARPPWIRPTTAR